MTSISDQPLVINAKTDFRYEAEVYSASVSVPVVPACPAWMPARMGNPFVDACQAASSPDGRYCLAKPALDYGSFDGREPERFALYLTSRGLWSRDQAEALRLSDASAQELLIDWSNYTEGAAVVALSLPEAHIVCTKYPEIFTALKAPFPPELLRKKTKKPKEGPAITLTYVDAHVVQDRLDEVLGPENWELGLQPWGTDLIGTMTITLPDGTKLSKSDAAGRPKMGDQVDEPKGAATHVLRRCAMLFGVGRYLCYKQVPRKSTIEDPKLRRDAAPPPSAGQSPATLPLTTKKAPDPKPERTLPEIKTARELYNFARANSLLPVLGELGRKGGMPPRIVDWPDSGRGLPGRPMSRGCPRSGKTELMAERMKNPAGTAPAGKSMEQARKYTPWRFGRCPCTNSWTVPRPPWCREDPFSRCIRAPSLKLSSADALRLS